MAAFRRILRRPLRHWMIVALLVFSAVSVLLGAGVSSALRQAVAPVLAPLGDGGMYLATRVERQIDRFSQRGISPGEARRLMERNKALRRRLQVAEGEWVRLLAERRAMDRLYGPIPYAQWTLVPARVVAADALPYGRRRLVNAGRTDGAEAGSAVTTRRLLTDRSKRLPSNVAALAAQTLAGRIINAGPFTATLQLVTDPDFAVAAKILRVIDPNDPRTITVTAGDASRQILSNRNNYPVPVLARGAGEGGLVVEDVSVHHNIQRGDRLVTAGDNAFLPVRVEIGVVREVINDPEQRGLYQTLRVTPSASLEALRQVFLVVPAGEASVGGGE